MNNNEPDLNNNLEHQILPEYDFSQGVRGKHYQAYGDGNSIFINKMKLKHLIQEKRQQIIDIAAKHGAYNIRIFGSVARGEDTENSDIDLLIDYHLDKITPWFPSGLMQDLQKILGRQVDIVTVNGLKERVKEKVLAEAVKL